MENGLKPLRIVVEGKGVDDWKSRVSLARWLSRQRYGKLEPAIKLFSSIINVAVTEPDDIENKAWALSDLGLCIWLVEENATKALTYMDMSIELAENTQAEFHFITRGELWAKRWQLLVKSGNGERAINEANDKIAKEFRMGFQSNSYLFHSYELKAQVAYEQGDIDSALCHYYQALASFPHEYEDMNQLGEIWENRQDNPQKTFDDMQSLTHHEVCWDI
jgi:tetratricopeptide (TPR) repeat protein